MIKIKHFIYMQDKKISISSFNCSFSRRRVPLNSSLSSKMEFIQKASISLRFLIQFSCNFSSGIKIKVELIFIFFKCFTRLVLFIFFTRTKFPVLHCQCIKSNLIAKLCNNKYYHIFNINSYIQVIL